MTVQLRRDFVVRVFCSRHDVAVVQLNHSYQTLVRGRMIHQIYGVTGTLQGGLGSALRTRHSSNGVYDHVELDDLKQATVAVAATAYELANRDEMFPCKRGK